jgi:predicted DNA-binding transcriptional regulator YafY
MLEVKNGSYLEFNYVNWEGLTSYRKVKVKRIYFGFTEYHKQDQWLMEALDLDKNELRTFSMEDMVNVIESN